MANNPADNQTPLDDNPYTSVQTNDAIGERGNIDIFLPKGVGPHPFVLCIHGGGWHNGNRKSYHWIPKRLRQRGLAVVTCSYRLKQEALYPAAYDDLVHLLNWLKTNAASHNLKDDGCVILGGSAGGHLVCLLSTRGLQENSQTFLPIKGVVSYCPVVNLIDQYEFGQTVNQHITKDFIGGSPSEKPEAYQTGSPIHYVTRQSPPLWISHGDSDTVVPMQATLDYTKVYQKAGATVTTHIEPGAGHTMTQPNVEPIEFLAEEAMLAFIRQCLNLQSDAASDKS